MTIRRSGALAGLLLAAVLAAVLAGCGGPEPDSTSTSSAAPVSGPTGGPGLEGQSWVLVAAAIDSSPLPDFGMSITFTATQVSGRSAVNEYAGSFSSSPTGAMDIGPLRSTAMGGSAEAMAAEQAYLAALAAVTGYRVAGSELSLFVGEQETLVFEPPLS